MPNLNLLQGKPFQKEVQPEAAESVTFEAFEPQPPEEPAPEPAAETPAVAPEATKTAGEVSYTRFGEGRSSWPIFAAVAGALIILAVLWWAYRGFKGGGKEITVPPDTTKAAVAEKPGQPPAETAGPAPEQPSPPATKTPAPPKTAPAPGQQPAPAESVPSAPAVRAPTLELERKQGTVAVSLLGDFLNAMPANMVVSFLSFDGKTYSAELGAKTPTAFSEFERNLKRLQSGFVLKTVYEYEKPVNEQVFTFRQVQGSVPAAATAFAASNSLPGNAIRPRLSRLARKHGLTVRQLSVAPAAQVGGHTFRPVTAKFAGTQTEVKNFLRDLLGTYSNVGVDRLVITQIVPSPSPNARVRAALDLNVYQD